MYDKKTKMVTPSLTVHKQRARRLPFKRFNSYYTVNVNFLVLCLWMCKIARKFNLSETGSRDGAVVRALAFHQCGPGSFPCPGVIGGLSFLLVLGLAPRVFSGYSSFPPSIKTNISKFQFHLDVKCLHMSPWLGRLGDYSPHYDVKFDLPYY